LTLTLFSKRSPLTLTGCLRFIPALINRGLGGCHDGVDLAEITRKSLGCTESGNDSKAGADLEEAIRAGYLVWGSETVQRLGLRLGWLTETKPPFLVPIRSSGRCFGPGRGPDLTLTASLAPDALRT
jgi:hypothetical protein